ncbi:MAG TPA: tRNA (adenosine(37)-N6)-threonylcarbamoyltransferase complex ATPase subunit type 1 TsaE [Clostridiales bacterium]|nr:tRNA (adenosine(37)-N6)-threonylcarbamoyltransferase complex ATPase subunit type 1 TsaE [Clostridiales bacterium]
MAVYQTNSEEETTACAAVFAKTLAAGCFVALDGELGAGKTAFVKGIARGLHVKENVVSPTFTILRVYESGRLPLYHYDAYRLAGEDGLLDVGFYDYAEGDGVCVCEWAERIKNALPKNHTRVAIRYIGEQAREIAIERVGECDCSG